MLCKRLFLSRIPMPPPDPMNGIILLDKPAGMTSHDVVDAVRKFAVGVKVGHAGTLDPHATGLLIILLGKATKVSRFLMGLDKEYVFIVQLGLDTDTLDRWGKTVSMVDAVERDEQEIVDVAARLTGRYEQVAPAVSALKHRGQPLYRLARRGEEVPEKVRPVEVKRFDVLDVTHPFVTARVVCSSGTYVRSLARDMGRLLGTVASVFCLRRTRIGTFGLDEAVGLDALTEEGGDPGGFVLPVSDALRHLPRIRIAEEGAEGLRMGRQPRAEDMSASDLDFKGAYAVLVDKRGLAVAIVRRRDGSATGLATERVL
jgi:tRNA pseudouridine55 synthase